MANPFKRKSMSEQLQSDLDGMRKRLSILAAKRSEAKATFDEAVGERQKYLLEGDLSDEKVADRLQKAVDRAASRVSGFDSAAHTSNAAAWYQHDDFAKGLAKATQAPWRRLFDHFREHKTPSGRRYGQNSIRTLPTKSIVDFLDAKDDAGNGRTINAKRNALKAIRSFIRFAISQCELENDPAEDIKISKKTGPKSIGHMTWLEPQVEQYRQRHPLGTMARLAIELLLNIAARREDAHGLGQQHIRIDENGIRRLTWRPHKTIRSTGRLLSIPIMSYRKLSTQSRKRCALMACSHSSSTNTASRSRLVQRTAIASPTGAIRPA
jgi:site-specific recombinase XerC